jgi:hypothetical protein
MDKISGRKSPLFPFTGITMNKPLSLIAVAFALTMGLSAGARAQSAPAAPAQAKMAPASVVSPAAPAVAPPAKTAQQSKMATCNKDAVGKKGDERKAFMKECLSAKKEETAAAPAQQSKMKTCNADATGKKGDERKAFMKECLSK